MAEWVDHGAAWTDVEAGSASENFSAHFLVKGVSCQATLDSAGVGITPPRSWKCRLHRVKPTHGEPAGQSTRFSVQLAGILADAVNMQTCHRQLHTECRHNKYVHSEAWKCCKVLKRYRRQSATHKRRLNTVR